MVDAEEQKMRERQQLIKDREARQANKGGDKKNHKEGHKEGHKKGHKEDDHEPPMMGGEKKPPTMP